METEDTTPKPLTDVHNRFAVAAHGSGVTILAPFPKYDKQGALNLIAWIAVIMQIEPEEISGAIAQVERT